MEGGRNIGPMNEMLGFSQFVLVVSDEALLLQVSDKQHGSM